MFKLNRVLKHKTVKIVSAVTVLWVTALVIYFIMNKSIDFLFYLDNIGTGVLLTPVLMFFISLISILLFIGVSISAKIWNSI